MRRAAEADCVARQRDLGAELLGLHLRPAGEFLPGDPHREAEVVLDLGTCPRLSAGGFALEYHRAKPLRGGVHRRREARRAGPDDRHVVHHAGVEVFGNPEAPGEFHVRRALQRRAAGADDHGAVARGEAEALQNRRAVVPVGVEGAHRVAVAAQEALDAHPLAGVRGADERD